MLAHNTLTFSVVGGMRKRNLARVVVGLILILELSFFMEISGGKKTIVVDISGKGDFKSIQEAVDAAREGDTILVREGRYREIVRVYKGVTISGENVHTTILDPDGVKNSFAISVLAEGVVLRNLTITNGNEEKYTQGVKVISSHVKIISCIIRDVPFGISIWSSGNVIKGCVFSNCKDEGIVLVGSMQNRCSNNTIMNCKFYNNGDAIEFQYADHNVVSNCIIVNNTHGGIDTISSYSVKNSFINCTITNNCYGMLIYPENDMIGCVFWRLC